MIRSIFACTVVATAWTAGCGGDDRPPGDGGPIGTDAARADAGGDDDGGPGSDSGPATDSGPGADGGALAFTCTMSDIVKGDQCLCLADGLCRQIHFCLDATDIAGRGAPWSPVEDCIAAVREDCMEDLTDPGLLPTEFTACIADIHEAMCADFGDFASVSEDFPATCENLRSVETALGIDP